MSALAWPHYEIQELRNMRDIREIFPSGRADHLNWCFCSSGGVHGTNFSLDTVEEILRGNHKSIDPLDNGKFFVTVLVLHPRLCVLKYGEIQVNLADVALLRKIVASSIVEIAKSQEGNV